MEAGSAAGGGVSCCSKEGLQFSCFLKTTTMTNNAISGQMGGKRLEEPSAASATVGLTANNAVRTEVDILLMVSILIFQLS